MGQALYRKYRSKSLDEIVGQEHITTTLKNAMKEGKLSHAYLLTGPRGVGKTSVARILAHELNGLPYSLDSSHLDIIEIDAASNRGIEEIRDLREKVHTAPTSAKHKVYIIDEVHMLTKQAFNALLKTLEEPPSHVVFILATTESHKLPETIISRTQRFTFKPVEHSQVTNHLRTLAKQEKINIDDEALDLIARHGEGSFRDSISMLDQASSSAKSVKKDDILRMLGIPAETAVSRLIETMLNGTPHELLDLMTQFRDQGFQAAAIAKQVGVALRRLLIAGQLDMPVSDITRLLGQLISVPSSHDPENMLEIVLLGINLERGNMTSNLPAPSRPIPKITQDKNASDKPLGESIKNAVDKPAKPNKDVVEPTSRVDSEAMPPTIQSDINDSTILSDIWPQVLATIKKRHNTLYSILRMASPSFSDNSLVLSFGFAFHQKKINEEKTRVIVSDLVTQLMGQPVTVVCIVEKGTKNPGVTVAVSSNQDNKKLNDSSLDAISNIFGGGEMLE